MNANEHPDDLLAPPPLPSELTTLREQVFRRTVRRLRWRRYGRRAALAAALAACWVGGMLTMRWLSPTAPPAPRVVESQPDDHTTPPSPPTALALEWEAFDRPEQQADLYRKAADAYQQERDPLSATRCYGRALDGDPAQTQTSAVGDDWLLIAIKNARKKEKIDAKSLD
jgi:hypothetical protein